MPSKHQASSKLQDRVRVVSTELLADDHYVLKKTTFEFKRNDGQWQRQSREVYDRGNGAAILLYQREKRTVLLTRQFRYPAFVNGYEDLLIEVAAGLLDEASPEERIRKEAEEETGYRIPRVEKVFEAFMSPGSVTEKLHFFIAEYSPDQKVSEGGGNESEGEDIEVFEVSIDQAMAMIQTSEIVDAKTILLLQYAKLNLFKS